MHIPARYYKRIPKFYFIVGILLVISSFNMEDNPLAAYLYFIAGVVSVIYAVSVAHARRKRRKNLPREDLQPSADDEAPIEENQASPVNKPPEFVNDNPAVADTQQVVDGKSQSSDKERAPDQEPQPATEQQSRSGTKDSELTQKGSGVTTPDQVEAKP